MLYRFILGLIAVVFISACATSGKINRKVSSNEYQKDITTIEEFLKWIDLETVYLSPNNEDGEFGSPGIFIAVPKIAKFAEPSFGDDPKTGKVDAIGYYYKAQTGLTIDSDYDDSASAQVGTTGGGWSCVVDDNSNIAKMDIEALNSKEVSKATTPQEKLAALSQGFRFAPLDFEGDADNAYAVGGIQTACYNKDNPDDPSAERSWQENFIAPWGERFGPRGQDMSVRIIAIWNGGSAGVEDDRKADGIEVYGPSFSDGNRFLWFRSKGTIKNADVLIDLYEKAGYSYTPSTN